MLVHWLFDREAMLATIAARDTTSHVVLATDRVLLPVPVVGQYQTMRFATNRPTATHDRPTAGENRRQLVRPCIETTIDKSGGRH